MEVAGTSLDHDMTTKAAVYAVAGIREYCVVDLSSRSVAILSDPRDGTYETRRTHRGGEPLKPADLPGCLVDPLAMIRRLLIQAARVSRAPVSLPAPGCSQAQRLRQARE